MREIHLDYSGSNNHLNQCPTDHHCAAQPKTGKTLTREFGRRYGRFALFIWNLTFSLILANTLSLANTLNLVIIFYSLTV